MPYLVFVASESIQSSCAPVRTEMGEGLRGEREGREIEEERSMVKAA